MVNESLAETLEILADLDAMADLAEADREKAAGELIPLEQVKAELGL